ncbi:MAG TPA: hypothetical protein VFW07_26640 [Parafilimonas sp.]|nr:hypothetical protein [Parafilimonas sp.]
MKNQKLLLAVCIACLCLSENARAQIAVEEAMTKKHPDCRDVFLNAIDVIPQLYRQHELDSLQKAIDIWKNACGEIYEVQYTALLLAIERSTYNSAQPDSNLIPLLNRYAMAYANAVTYNAYYGESAGYYKISATWGRLLLARPGLTKTEAFICNVFAGNIKEPEKEIRQHKEEYSTLYTLLNEALAAQKKAGSVECTVLTGIWIPTNNAAVLGVHPSLGIQVGGRYNRHQVDFTIQFRFLESAGVYTVERDNNLYDLDHYFGGYIGIDYNYYFINRTKTDVGLLAGAGYDGFDIANSGNDHHNDYLKPLSISSFNFNTGLRFNYVFNPKFYLGLQARYNCINYSTGGGSSLAGDAFSADLIIGFTTRTYARQKRY